MVRVLVVLLAGLMTNCAASPGIGGGVGTREVGDGEGGAGAVGEDRVWRAEDGGEVAYTLWQPERKRTDVLVVLGHGFLRERGRMAVLAEALAEGGVVVACLDFRHSRAWAGRHRENAEDMVGLASSLGAERVIYAGFSAGGLSALHAAADDGRAIGFLGLDLVDDGTGEGAAGRVGFPLHGLMAPASRCNAGGNGTVVYEAAETAELVLVEGASHCDFEGPVDPACLLLCRRPESAFTAAEIQGIVIDLAVASVLAQAGVVGEGEARWDLEGEWLGGLVEEGRVRVVGAADE